MKRPRSSIDSVILHTTEDNDGNYIPTRYSVNSWVELNPGTRGKHAKDATKHQKGAFKAQILQFRLNPGSTTVSKVLVQHAYMFRQLQLHPDSSSEGGACNYIYPSDYKDWIDPKSIIGVIYVLHADIGEACRAGRSNRELLDDGVYYYNAKYYPSTVRGEYGYIEKIPLPGFDDPQWPLPDLGTSEAFRAKFRRDFLFEMKPNTGSRVTHLQWFVPIGVFVDLFAVAHLVHKIATFFVFKNPSEDLLSSLMDNGWHEKITVEDDGIRCSVDKTSIVFRYHIGRSTLYCNFQFNRMRFSQNSKQWEAIDQWESAVMVAITFEMGDWKQVIEVEQNWTFLSLRQEVLVLLGHASPNDFSFYIVEDNMQAKKVNRRNEEKFTAKNVLPPKRLQIISSS